MSANKLGFTLVEMVLVIGIVTTLSLLTTQSFFRGTRSATLAEESGQVVRDMRDAQFRSMEGIPIGGSSVDYSIRFETDRYILFPGLVYSAGNADNQTTLLPPGMEFSFITFPDSQVSFARGSGDVRAYASSQNSVTLTDTSIGQSERIHVNPLGVVFSDRQ